MKRLASILLAAALLLPVTVHAETSHWKDLNAALAPVNVALNDDVIAFNGAFADAAQAHQDIGIVSVFDHDGMQAVVGKLVSAQSRMDSVAHAIKTDAAKG